mgnify:CR=1 FL=1
MPHLHLQNVLMRNPEFFCNWSIEQNKVLGRSLASSVFLVFSLILANFQPGRSYIKKEKKL